MRPYWQKLAGLAQKHFTLDSFQLIGVILAFKGYPFYSEKDQKVDYKMKVICTISKLLLAHRTTALPNTAQCVSNALNSEAHSVLKTRSSTQSECH